MTLTEEQGGFDLEKARDALDEPMCHAGQHRVVLELQGALAEIGRLRAEMDNYGDDFVCQMKSKDARIKELEDAHKRSGAKYAKIINELRSSVYANIPGLKKQWDEILNAPANGKIGPDADAKPHCWQITEERKDALRDAAETLADRSLGDWETIDVLNVMLTEADHDKP